MIKEMEEYLNKNGDAEIVSVGTVSGNSKSGVRFILYPSASSYSSVADMESNTIRIHEN